MAVLQQIKKENDIKRLEPGELKQLAAEIREFLLQNVSVTGGHLASNLGAVELTIALHYTMNFPEDKLIWDVGHQSYAHKILTGRQWGFENLRQFGGMSGFPKCSESACDCFNTGHSSTSISAGLGFAKAREITGEKCNVVSVIGDGALTGGMAFEALNNASQLKSNYIIVLNDNKMSISENVGGLSNHLASLRTAEAYQEFKSEVYNSLSKLPYGERVVRRIQKTKNSLKQLLIPGMFFENMGITYLGPVNGHNLGDMIHILTEAKKVNGAVVVHMQTEKGKGYIHAEQHPERFHGTPPFDIESGQVLKKKEKPDYTDVFSAVICKMAEKDPTIVALTAAMEDGTGLKRFHAEYPDRFFDVGIAEEHAVTFSAGLAAGGLRPVFAVYSSFLQRAYDQMMHDVCLQDLPVMFAVDRAGLVGADGETHQGIFDLSFLSSMPNMTIMAPKNKWEMADMLRFGIDYKRPIAVRYPRGTAYEGLKEFREPIVYGKSELIYKESQIAIVAVGSMVGTADSVKQILHDRGYSCTLVNARFVKPIDEQMMLSLEENHSLIVTLEENVLNGGFGSAVTNFLCTADSKMKILNIGIPDCFVEHGSVAQLYKEIGLDAETVADKIQSAYEAKIMKKKAPFLHNADSADGQQEPLHFLDRAK